MRTQAPVCWGGSLVVSTSSDRTTIDTPSADQRWPRWQTLGVASEYASLSQASLRRLVAAGRLTAHRPVRGRVLLDQVEIDALIGGATAEPRTGRGRATNKT